MCRVPKNTPVHSFDCHAKPKQIPSQRTHHSAARAPNLSASPGLMDDFAEAGLPVGGFPVGFPRRRP